MVENILWQKLTKAQKIFKFGFSNFYLPLKSPNLSAIFWPLLTLGLRVRPEARQLWQLGQGRPVLVLQYSSYVLAETKNSETIS